MEQIQPDVIPEALWIAIRNMGRAIHRLGDLPLPAGQAQEKANLMVHWRWTDFVAALEAWMGPSDIAGVERWPYDEIEAGDDDVERWLDRLRSGENTLDTLTARIADMTARRDGLQALWEWRQAHPDTDV